MAAEECAKYLKSISTIHRLAQEDKIPAVKVNNQWRFQKRKLMNSWKKGET